MNDSVPDLLRIYTVGDAEAHRVKGVPDHWTATFRGHEAVYSKLTAHSEAAGGIARGFIHDHARPTQPSILR